MTEGATAPLCVFRRRLKEPKRGAEERGERLATGEAGKTPKTGRGSRRAVWNRRRYGSVRRGFDDWGGRPAAGEAAAIVSHRDPWARRRRGGDKLDSRQAAKKGQEKAIPSMKT